MKDQDRARWFEPGQIASVSDGVTSSPNAANGAEIATLFSPALFKGNAQERVRVLCDLLLSHRQEYMLNHQINMPNGTSEFMQQKLRNIVQNKIAFSFQTTLIAAQFETNDETVFTRIIKCGDSAFFAFSPEGELLTSSLTSTSQCNIESSGSVYHPLSHNPKRILFGPGRKILVQITGPLSDDQELALRAGISLKHIQNWIVCSPQDSCQDGQTEVQSLSERHSVTLHLDDQLIIPKYLYGKHLTSQGTRYKLLRYSSAMKHIPRSGYCSIQPTLGGAGSSTLVLPDHFYTGDLEYYRDTFPRGTQFLLCSDGFYSAFQDWTELHTWLKSNAAVLGHIDSRRPALEQIHERLRDTKGDDDVSFIWATPKGEERQVNHVY